MFWGTHGLHCPVCFSPLFSLWSGCMDFSADLAKQRRKNSWGGFEVSKNDFCVYFVFWCVVFFVPIYSVHAVERHARHIENNSVNRATRSPNHSAAGNLVDTAIPDSPMRSIAMDVFAMPEVTVEGEKYDCIISAVDRHSGYIVAVPGKKSKKKDKNDKHGVAFQAKTVAQAMIRHRLTIFDVPAVICSDRGSQFVGSWLESMCKHMGIQHAKTVAYHSRSNGRAEVAGRQMFEKSRQLHIEEPGRNWFHCLWRVLQAFHD